MEQFDILTMGDIKLYNFAQDSDINIKNTFITIFKELYEPLINNDYFLYENNYVQIQENDIVVDLLYSKHLALIISEPVIPQPKRLQMRRKGKSVMPAIGASAKGTLNSRLPNFIIFYLYLNV